MSTEYPIDAKIYHGEEGHKLSMRDLLGKFARWGAMRVSDLHLKVGCPPTYRVDGMLKKLKGPALDVTTVKSLAFSLLEDVEIRRLEEKRSLDSSHTAAKLQFRLNFFHDSDGLAVAIRALDPKPIELEQIGFPNNIWKDILNKQWGLVLVTGITGAGKSTTIASFINRIAHTHPCHIITLEDPIEYRLPSDTAVISQRQVGRDVADFAAGLRDCLREDPNVIFVGEMRDRESTSWALTAAETGHLVFSTLHTRDARGTISRLLDMFPANQQDEVASQLSLGLGCIISQKLIPTADNQGRVVAMEILNNTYAVSNLIRTRKLEQIYTQLQTKTKDTAQERMVTLERSLARLVASGRIAALEAEKWANHPTAFVDELKRVQSEK